MKKSKLILLALSLSLGLIACGSKDEMKTTTAADVTATTASNVADVTTAVGDETAEAKTGGDPQGANPTIFDMDVSEYIDLSGLEDLKIMTREVTYDDYSILLKIVDEALKEDLGITVKDKDCTAKVGDIVEVRFSCYEKDVLLEDSVEIAILLDSSNKVLPEAVVYILGRSINDEFEFTVSYPKDYDDPVVAGKTLDFKMVVLDIIGMSTVSDEKIKTKTFGKYETCQAFSEAKVAEAKRTFRNQRIFEEIKCAVNVKKLHEGMINEMVQKKWDLLDQSSKAYGVDRETLLRSMGYSVEEFDNYIRGIVEIEAKERLIILGICRQGGYRVTDDELSELKQKMIAEQHLASEEELMKTVTEDDLKWQLYEDRLQKYIDNFKTID